MKFLIIFLLTLATAFAFALSDKGIHSRNIVVPAGRPKGRVTNGNRAYEGQFPYQAFLRLHIIDGTTMGSGSLISHTVILTAAHCTEGTVKIEVNLGSIDVEHPKVSYEVTPDNVLIYPGYNRITYENDISIIKIPYTSYSEYIQPVTLPTRDLFYYSYNDQAAVASGWGLISDSNPSTPTILRYANFNVIYNAVCTTTWTTQLCVSTYNQTSICYGDSGGPLVLEYSKILIGITSLVSLFGCERNQPAVFTRVTSFLDWIEQNSDVSP